MNGSQESLMLDVAQSVSPIILTDRKKERCSVDGCGKEVVCKGLCDMHYTRTRRYGNVGGKRPRRGNGEGCLRPTGYILTQIDKRRVADHVRIAEKALGKRLPISAKVHHVNGKRSDNYTPFNLVICQDAAYHQLLHLRTKAIKNGFPPHYRKCRYCKTYSNPASMKECRGSYRHAECKAVYDKERRLNG